VHLRDNCCSEKTTIPSFFIVDVLVAVNNIHIESAAIGTQQCFLFIVKVLVAVNNVHVESVTMGTQQCFLFIVALRMSVPAISKTLESARKVPDIFVPF
jgi:hypothetical protein